MRSLNLLKAQLIASLVIGASAMEPQSIHSYDRDDLGPDPIQEDTGIRHGKRAFNDNRLALQGVAIKKRTTANRKANKLAKKQRKQNRK